LPPGVHRVDLEVLDAAGNRSEVSWTVLVAPPGLTRVDGPVADAAAVEGAAAGRLHGETASSHERREAAAAAAGWAPDPVGITLESSSAAGEAPAERWLTPFVELARTRGGAWAELDPRRPAAADSAAAAATPHWRRLVLEPGPGSALLAPTAVYFRPDSVAGAEARALATRLGLAALGPALGWVATDWPVSGPVLVPWPIDVAVGVADSTVALFRQTEPGAWRWAGRLQPPSGEGGAWRLPLAGPGRYALLRDLRPPTIGGGPGERLVRRQVPRHSAGVTLPRWQIVNVAVGDAGSGIDPGSIVALLDGAPLIPEPDLIHGRVRLELPDTLPAGRHALVLSLRDRAGLAARRRLALLCRATG
jgi:hypothetical protein